MIFKKFSSRLISFAIFERGNDLNSFEIEFFNIFGPDLGKWPYS